MKAYKWNMEKGDCEEIAISNFSALYNIEGKIACASCGSKFDFNKMYMSIFIKDKCGCNYAICEKCYDEELKEEAQQRKNFVKKKKDEIPKNCIKAVEEIMQECDKYLLCEACPFVEYNEDTNLYICFFNKYLNPSRWGALIKEK